MVQKRNYLDWSKEELIREIFALKKQKTYGLVWEREKTKEDFDLFINWEGEKTKEEFGSESKDKFPVLTEVKEKEILTDKEKPINLIIEGDNYHSLAVLNFTHKGMIDVIYIDPPYNRGSTDFKYNDKYVDLEDGYRHSKWLSFMSKRLLLAKNLLTENGLIFISIDDNEIAQLKLLCDEIFTENNLLAVLVWDLGTGTQAGHFTRAHEYILAYAKKKESLDNFSSKNNGEIEHSALKKISYKNPASHFRFPAGTRFDGKNGLELKNSWGGSEKTKLIQGRMICENGKLKHDVVLEAGWAQKRQMGSWFAGKETFDTKKQKILEFYFNKNGVLRYRKTRDVINPKTVIKEVGSTKHGSELLKQIFNGRSMFDFPKPLDLVKYLISLGSNKESLVLDFFAGSGTTGHAVLELNNEDGGNRKFILCTNDEGNICRDVCYPRIQKVINGYTHTSEVEGLGGNLKYFMTAFVEAAPTDKNKRTLVDKCTEMLCIKETAFDKVKDGQKWKIFKNEHSLLGIIFDDEYIEDFVREAEKISGEFKVYVFSHDDFVSAKEFKSIKNRVTLCAIPEVILKVYRKVFKND